MTEERELKLAVELPQSHLKYGDFGFDYIGSEARLHFRYAGDGGWKTGELRFDFCLAFSTNGQLDQLKYVPANKLLIAEENVGFDKTFTKYVLELTGSDFQFEVVAQGFALNADIGKSPLILDDAD